jgi:hypothetical protein
VTGDGDTCTLALLAFWGRNMAPIRARGWVWPGFDYSEAEWKRLLALADAVSGGAYLAFQIVTAVLIIAAIGLAVTLGASVVIAFYRITPFDWLPLVGPGLLVAIALAVYVLLATDFHWRSDWQPHSPRLRRCVPSSRSRLTTPSSPPRSSASFAGWRHSSPNFHRQSLHHWPSINLAIRLCGDCLPIWRSPVIGTAGRHP